MLPRPASSRTMSADGPRVALRTSALQRADAGVVGDGPVAVQATPRSAETRGPVRARARRCVLAGART